MSDEEDSQMLDLLKSRMLFKPLPYDVWVDLRRAREDIPLFFSNEGEWLKKCETVRERRIKAQRTIYKWIIPIIYRPGSDSAKRLVESSWKKTCELSQEKK